LSEPAFIPSSTATDVGEIEGVGVDELDAVVALFLDLGHADHDRFGAQIQPHERVRGVRIGRLDRRIRRRIDFGNVLDLVPGRLARLVVVVDEVGVLDAVAVHHRIAVDVGLPGDCARFFGDHGGAGALCDQG